MQVWFIVSLLFSVIVAVFAVLNSSVVTINLVFQSFEMSQSIVILASAVAGAVIVLFLGLFSKVKTSLKIRELNNALKASEKKNELLSSSVKSYENKVQDVKVQDVIVQDVKPQEDRPVFNRAEDRPVFNRATESSEEVKVASDDDNR